MSIHFYSHSALFQREFEPPDSLYLLELPSPSGLHSTWISGAKSHDDVSLECKFRLFKKFSQTKVPNKMFRSHLALHWEPWSSLQQELHNTCSPRALSFNLQKVLNTPGNTSLPFPGPKLNRQTEALPLLW